MNTLTDFVRHQLENQPGTAGAPSATDSRNSPPLGKTPAPAPALPLPPAAPLPAPVPVQDQDQNAVPGPYTNGTPLAAHQKNAADFLAGNTPGVMADFMPTAPKAAPPQAAAPTQQDDETVQRLVEWREEAPY